MAALFVSVVLALLSGSLVNLTAPSRRMWRMKRLSEASVGLGEGRQKAWVQRRLEAEMRILRRELGSVKGKELWRTVLGFWSGAAAVVAFLMARTPKDFTGSGVMDVVLVVVAWGLLLNGIFALMAAYTLRWKRLAVWQRKRLLDFT